MCDGGIIIITVIISLPRRSMHMGMHSHNRVADTDFETSAFVVINFSDFQVMYMYMCIREHNF